MTEHPKSTENAEFHESKKLSSDDRRVVLVDVDETICFYEGERRYDKAIGHTANIAKINKLYDEGWYVIYWTARGGSKKSRALERCYYEFTWGQLESWGCKFHDLSTGSKGKYIKPACDLIIDDKSKRIEEL
jgi:nicotinamidase-related amidase